MSAHATRAHSERGPSQSHRWRKCMASIQLCADLPDAPPTQAALDGTYAHEWGEYCLKNGEWDASDFIGEQNPDNPGRPLERNVAENVNQYLGLVAKIIASEDELFVEERFDLSRYFGGTPDGNGTGDCVIYKPTTRHLHVIDYKNGFEAVAAEDNTQGIQYALGAWERFKGRGVEKITIWIVQPRAPGESHKRWTISAADLFDHGADLKADYAQSLKPGNPFVPGKHCKYCKANIHGRCAAVREFSRSKAAEGFEAIKPNVSPDGLQEWGISPEGLGQMLDEAEAIRAYLKALDELADREARAGRVPAGRKWVATPGKRVWSPALGEPEKIAAAILARLPNAPVWNRELETAPALEKLIGKKEFLKLADLIAKTAGGFSLVAESDARPAVPYSRGAEGFEAVT